MLSVVVAVLSLVSSDGPPKGKENELPEAAQKEVQKLQGKWRKVKVGVRGKEYTAEKGDPELIGEFKGRKWYFEGIEKGEIVALDPAADPKLLDLKSLEKARDGAVDEAIYKVTGDTLTICLYQGKGKKRPTTFDIPNDGTDTILMVFERVPEKPKK